MIGINLYDKDKIEDSVARIREVVKYGSNEDKSKAIELLLDFIALNKDGSTRQVSLFDFDPDVLLTLSRQLEEADDTIRNLEYEIDQLRSAID